MFRLVPCPICRQSIPVDAAARPEHFPFCSERCKLIDLGDWAAERYRVRDSQPPLPETTTDDQESE